jgi:hypothetical protein
MSRGLWEITCAALFYARARTLECFLLITCLSLVVSYRLCLILLTSNRPINYGVKPNRSLSVLLGSGGFIALYLETNRIMKLS